MLDPNDIQGDIVIGLQKDAENFIFFKIADKFAFKGLLKQHVVGRITSAELVHQRELTIQRRPKLGYITRERFEPRFHPIWHDAAHWRRAARA
jgi:hypothetical protein